MRIYIHDELYRFVELEYDADVLNCSAYFSSLATDIDEKLSYDWALSAKPSNNRAAKAYKMLAFSRGLDSAKPRNTFDDPEGICEGAYMAAESALYNFVSDPKNLDVILTPPADRPYYLSDHDLSVTGLFGALDKYAPASDRVSAQRCYLAALVPHYKYDRKWFIEAPQEVGFETWDQAHSLSVPLVKTLEPKLKAMPVGEVSGYDADEEPGGDLEHIIKLGSASQKQRFLRAVATRLPQCYDEFVVSQGADL